MHPARSRGQIVHVREITAEDSSAGTVLGQSGTALRPHRTAKRLRRPLPREGLQGRHSAPLGTPSGPEFGVWPPTRSQVEGRLPHSRKQNCTSLCSAVGVECGRRWGLRRLKCTLQARAPRRESDKALGFGHPRDPVCNSDRLHPRSSANGVESGCRSHESRNASRSFEAWKRRAEPERTQLRKYASSPHISTRFCGARVV